MSLPFFQTDEKIAVALSGGPDSMALAHMLSHQSSAVDIHALIVDHGLRSESGAEARETFDRVKNWPNVIPHILTWGGDKPDTKIMEEARRARYGLMRDFCREHGISTLYLAHHLDDQAETFLIRLAKGSGLDGLAAMSRAQDYDGLTLVRPLLDVPKSDLLAYCDTHNIPFARDPSNEKTDYLRPRLRGAREVLEAEGLTSKRLATTAMRLSRARAALEFFTDEGWRDHVTVGADIQINAAALNKLPEEVVLRVVLKAMDHFRPDADYGPRLERVESLVRDMRGDAFRGATLGGCRFAIKGRDRALWVVEKE